MEAKGRPSTDLRLANFGVEDLVEDDEAVGGGGRVPFDQHVGRLGHHDLVGHRTGDVVCFICENQTQRGSARENHMVHQLFPNLPAEQRDVPFSATRQCLRNDEIFDWATFLTLRHGSSADVSGHAAALEVPGVVARHDLDLVAGEVVQVGNDGRLLGGHL